MILLRRPAAWTEHRTTGLQAKSKVLLGTFTYTFFIYTFLPLLNAARTGRRSFYRSGELPRYRDAVGARCREIVRSPRRPEDMKRKVSPESVQRILAEGGVTPQKNSVWLLDFWEKKGVAGLLLMPLTRHRTLHLNDCWKRKQATRTRKTFFLHRYVQKKPNKISKLLAFCRKIAYNRPRIK